MSADNLAIKDGKGWRRGNADLYELEKKYDCALASYRRKQAIDKEREAGNIFFESMYKRSVNQGIVSNGILLDDTQMGIKEKLSSSPQ